MSLRSRSPVFFTGCMNNSTEKVCENMAAAPGDLLSAQDYKNLSDALDSLLNKSHDTASLSHDTEKACNTEPKRPYLLPLPTVQQRTQNGFQQQPTEDPNLESFSLAASHEVEVSVNHIRHEVSSMGHDVFVPDMEPKRPFLLPVPDRQQRTQNGFHNPPSDIPDVESSPSASFGVEASVNHNSRGASSSMGGDIFVNSSPSAAFSGSPRREKNYKRKFSSPAPELGFHAPSPWLNDPFSPRVNEEFYVDSQQVNNEDFSPYNNYPSSSTSPRTSSRKRKSEPPFINKRRRVFSPERRVPSAENGSPLLQMSDILWKVYHNNRQTPEELNHKFALRNQLHDILKAEFPHSGLYIVGSTMNGMGTKNCDMDLCLMVSHLEVDQSREAVRILRQVSKVFSKCKFIEGLIVIRAKVPILKFKDTIRGIDVDLNINNAVGIRNTQLLNSYSRIDQRVSPLVIIVKLWARTYEINDAKISTFSSYSLALMILHYLQCVCDPPVVPCLQQLQPDKYDPDSDVRKLRLEEELPAFVSQNRQCLGELFLGFLNYYANEFNFTDSVISLRIGSLIPRELAVNFDSPKNKKAHWKCVCIEEPFDLTNTARSVYNEEIFEYILSVFRRSSHLLNNTLEVSRIMEIAKLLEPNR